jgi:hypothetical protein
MIDINVIADLVAEDLKDYSAFVSYAPEFTLASLDREKCVVVPVGYEDTIASRNSDMVECRIEIGFLKRGKNLDVPALSRCARDIAKRFLRKNFGGTTCFKVQNRVLADPESLRERNQFTSVITLHFKGVE